MGGTGTLALNNAPSANPVDFQVASGTFSGRANVNHCFVSPGANLAPGFADASGAYGIFTASSNVVLSAGSFYTAQLDGPGPAHWRSVER